MMQNLRQKLGSTYGFQPLYNALGKTRQHFFQQKQRDNYATEVEELIISIVITWRKNHPKMGSRAMYYSLQQAGVDLGVGVTKFEQLLSRNKLTVRKAVKYGPITTDSNGVNKSYPNLANGLIFKDINKLIVSDITYFWINGKWHYLFLFKDIYSQRILSIIPSQNMRAVNCLSSLDEIIELRGESALRKTIFHSDNGKQYDAIEFKNKLSQLKMRISRAKACQENGSAEQLNHITKNMYLNNWKISNFKEFRVACEEFKYLNNNQRAIKQLDYLTPNNFETAIKKIKIKDRKIKTLYDFKKWK